MIRSAGPLWDVAGRKETGAIILGKVFSGAH